MPRVLTDHSCTRPESLVQCESMFVIVCLSARMLGDRTAAPPRRRWRITIAIYLWTCQNMAQSRFTVRVTRESKHIGDTCRNSWPCRHFPSGPLQALSNKLCPASRQKPKGSVPWGQDVIVSKHNRPVRMPGADPEGVVPDASYLTYRHVRIWYKPVWWCGSFTNRDLCLTGAEILDPHRHSPFATLQAPSNNLGPAIRQRPGGGPLRPRCMQTQSHCTCARRHSRLTEVCGQWLIFIAEKGGISGGLPRVWEAKILCCRNRMSLF